MTANKMYKRYRMEGGSLTFKEWIDREKKKSFLNFDGTQIVPVNQPLTDALNETINDLHKDAGQQSTVSTKYIFGVNKYIWIGAGIVTAVVIGVVIYNKTKK